MGLALWPAAHEIFLLSEWLGLSSIGSQQIAAAEAMLSQFQAVPLWLIVATMAVVPAICEELCFRGFVFGALRTRLDGVWTAILSAALFGVFHEVLFSGRLLPSTFLGLVLGFVRLRSGSVLPGILLHALYNGLLLSVSYYRDELLARGWGIEEETHLPFMWHGVAIVGILVGVGLLVVTTGKRVAIEVREPPSGEMT